MSGTAIAFRNFPQSTWRVPGFYPEFNSDLANTAAAELRALLIGQMLSTGTATPNVPIQAFSLSQVQQLCGVNSMLALMYQAYRLQDAFGAVWILPLSDNAGGTANITTATFTGPATAAGTLALYVAGISVPVAVSNGDTATIIGTNVAAIINSTAGLPCTATAAAGVVTLTSLHKGIAAGDLDVQLNFLGSTYNEATPAGVGMTVANPTPGALNPVLTTGLLNIMSRTYDFIVNPYTDATSIAAMTLHMNDQQGRWAAINQLFGHVFTSFDGTLAARTTFCGQNNDRHLTIQTVTNCPTPVYIMAADWAGAHAVVYRVNPALGVVGQPLNIRAPKVVDQDSAPTMNTLLYSGSSIITVDTFNQARIGRSITNWQKNQAGQPDDSYLQTNLLFQAQYVARYLITNVLTMFQNKVLVADGTSISAGSIATTPALIFSAVCAMYNYLSNELYICQNAATFKANGYAMPGTKGQVLLYLPVDFSDQVIEVAALIQFRQST